VIVDFMGSIAAKPGGSILDKARWKALIQEHTCLATNETFDPASGLWVYDLDSDFAYVKVSDCVVGTMRWADGARGIHVFGDGEPTGRIASEVAELLGGLYDSNALMATTEYGRLIEPIWETINIYDGPEIFLAQFGVLRPEIGHLFAAQWCESEVCNGGFHQFFYNSTGVLAPEALAAFRAIGLHEWAEILDEAMRFFGEPYPRDQEQRQKLLDAVDMGEDGEGNPFDRLDEKFYECARFENAANEYARAITG
jgi:Domain of unknown function (DUF4375)